MLNCSKRVKLSKEFQFCVGALKQSSANWNSKRVTNNKLKHKSFNIKSQFQIDFLITSSNPLLPRFLFCCLRLQFNEWRRRKSLSEILHEQLRKTPGVINLIAADMYGENRFFCKAINHASNCFELNWNEIYRKKKKIKNGRFEICISCW